MANWEEQLQNYWRDRLVRFSSDQVSQLNIDQQSKDILQRIGLPQVAINFSVIFNVAEKLERIEFEKEQYIILGENVGDDLGIFVCIKESSSEIYQLHTRIETNTFYMNSDLKSFLIYLYEYSAFVLKGQTLSEDEFIENDEMRNGLKEIFLSIDPKALSKSNHYWVMTLAEFGIYL